MHCKDQDAVATREPNSLPTPPAHRQSALIAASEYEADDQAFVDAVTVDWDDDVEPAE